MTTVMETQNNSDAPELSKPHMSVLIAFSGLALGFALLEFMLLGWAV